MLFSRQHHPNNRSNGKTIFLLLAAAAVHVAAQVPGLNFGPAYLMQRTSSYLVEYSTTLRVPKAPATNKGLVVVWPGINTDARPTNLVQTCIGGANVKASYCALSSPKVQAGEWCAFTSTNIGISQQRAGKGVAVAEGKDLHILYRYDETTKQFLQTLTVDGKELSRQSLAVGKGTRFNTAVEAQYGFSGVIDAHTYKNNTFIFAAADPGFPRSITKGRGITASTPVSADGGKTWTVDEIAIPASSYGSAKTGGAPAAAAAPPS